VKSNPIGQQNILHLSALRSCFKAAARLYLALFLLLHGNVKRGLIGAAMLSMSVLTLAFAAPHQKSLGE